MQMRGIYIVVSSASIGYRKFSSTQRVDGLRGVDSTDQYRADPSANGHRTGAFRHGCHPPETLNPTRCVRCFGAAIHSRAWLRRSRNCCLGGIFPVPCRAERKTKGPCASRANVTALLRLLDRHRPRGGVSRAPQSPPISNDLPAYTLRKVSMGRPVQRITSLSRCLNSAEPCLNA